MITKVRDNFNKNYKEEYYENLLKDVEQTFGEPCAFRISETPVFISKTLKEDIFETCYSILDQLKSIDFNEIRDRFIPKELQSPSPITNPDFLAIDFGLCDDGNGNIVPKLIELQAFPTLFFYQPWLGTAFYKHYPNMPKDGFKYYFSDLNLSSYKEEVKELIVGNENIENVILLELDPKNQKTRIDFTATQQALGIEVVDMTDVIKDGRKLYYLKNGKKVEIKRIYNRVILDELNRHKDLKVNFKLNDDLDVHWVSHPDWFFMISKCIMPFLKHKNIPDCYYLNDFPENLDLSKFVLKPLFSFAGQGINLRPTLQQIEAITDKENYILQQKVQYASLIETPTDKNSKVELRMLFIWDKKSEGFKPVINLTRMSKGELINVSHNTDEGWIGSSISLFEDS